MILMMIIIIMMDMLIMMMIITMINENKVNNYMYRHNRLGRGDATVGNYAMI